MNPIFAPGALKRPRPSRRNSHCKCPARSSPLLCFSCRLVPSSASLQTRTLRRHFELAMRLATQRGAQAAPRKPHLPPTTLQQRQRCLAPRARRQAHSAQPQAPPPPQAELLQHVPRVVLAMQLQQQLSSVLRAMEEAGAQGGKRASTRVQRLAQQAEALTQQLDALEVDEEDAQQAPSELGLASTDGSHQLALVPPARPQVREAHANARARHEFTGVHLRGPLSKAAAEAAAGFAPTRAGAGSTHAAAARAHAAARRPRQGLYGVPRRAQRAGAPRGRGRVLGPGAPARAVARRRGDGARHGERAQLGHLLARDASTRCEAFAQHARCTHTHSRVVNLAGCVRHRTPAACAVKPFVLARDASTGCKAQQTAHASASVRASRCSPAEPAAAGVSAQALRQRTWAARAHLRSAHPAGPHRGALGTATVARSVDARCTPTLPRPCRLCLVQWRLPGPGNTRKKDHLIRPGAYLLYERKRSCTALEVRAATTTFAAERRPACPQGHLFCHTPPRRSRSRHVRGVC